MTSSTANVVLEARDLTRDLGGQVKTHALRRINLKIRDAEFVSLTGPSGSGKSTLLYLLGALDRPTSGTVLIDGNSLDEVDEAERLRLRSRLLGFVFQFHFLLPEFSVLENVMLPMLRQGELTRRNCEDRARAVLDSLGLDGYRSRRPNELSGGQQQRTSIARAIAHRPRILLADEPTGNLDSQNGLAVMELFSGLVTQYDLTIVLVTHERGFAERTSRQIELVDGNIVSDSADAVRA